MQNSDWGPLSTTWQRQIQAVVQTPSEAANAGAPAAWCALLESECVRRTQAMWAGARDALPFFHDYLHRQLDDVAVGVGPVGTVLLYRFRDWVDDGDGFLPGVMVAGPAMSKDHATKITQTAGRLPDGLHAVWSHHAYIQLKNGSVLGPPSAAKLIHAASHDYLAIVNSSSSYPTCIRRPHHGEWTDDVVMVVPTTGEANYGGSLTVDGLLVDWSTLRWPPENYIDM
jgi:hypothetical protein